MFTGYTTNKDMYQKDVTFTDVNTGETVAYHSLKINTWYYLVIDLHDFIATKTLPSDHLVMYPNAAKSSVDCEIIFKDATVRETLIDDNKYTVTFDSDGGPSVPSQRLESGEKVAEPYGIVRVSAWEEYDFLGWYLGDGKWDFDNDTVEENITLKAKWKLVAKYGPEILP